MITHARKSGFPLETTEILPNGTIRAVPQDAIVLWDSLLLECLSHCPPAPDGSIYGLLVHYVPFLNPLLDTVAREREKERFERAAERIRFFIAPSPSVRRFLEHHYPGRPVFLCEPGIDDAFPAARRAADHPAEDQTVRVVTVANLLPAKGMSELLDSLADLRHYDWVWHLAGDPQFDLGYAEFFRSRIAELGLKSRIHLHGVLATPELARVLGKMDVFAFASRFEAYGMALAEAAAVGLPVVTTNVGEAQRIVRHGQTGFVVPLADRDAFRKSLERLLSEPALRCRFRARLLLNKPRVWDKTFADFRNAFRAAARLLREKTTVRV